MGAMPKGHLGQSAPATKAAFAPAMAWDKATIGTEKALVSQDFLKPRHLPLPPPTKAAGQNQIRKRSNNWINDLTKDKANHLVVVIFVTASM
jgi:hypothetical protein